MIGGRGVTVPIVYGSVSGIAKKAENLTPDPGPELHNFTFYWIRIRVWNYKARIITRASYHETHALIRGVPRLGIKSTVVKLNIQFYNCTHELV